MYTIEQQYLDQEVKRLLKLLGDTIYLDHYDYDALLKRAKYINVPVNFVIVWWTARFEKGEEGLRPNWGEITESDWEVALERHAKLGNHIDDEVLTDKVIDQIREAFDKSETQSNRYIFRYRVCGKWGLAPGNAPDQQKTKASDQSPDLGALDNNELDYIFEQYEIIQPLAAKAKRTNEEVQKRAEECGVSPRKVRYLLSSFDVHGKAGLARKERSDKGGVHKIGEIVSNIVLGVRLSFKDAPPRYVLKETCRRARALGEPEPTMNQVRDLIQTIPLNVLWLADGRVRKFRSYGRLTHRINFLKIGMVYQLDATQVPNVVHDLRDKRYATKSGEVRPWLTAAIECATNVIVARIFTYDRPDRFVVAAVFRQAFLTTPEKPFGGKPDQAWVDTGKYFVANHVKRIMREADITLCPHKNHPELEGHIERHFETAETQLWSTLQGYTGPNVQERNPTVKAHETIADLAAEYDRYLAEEYHVQVHSELGQSPASFWHEHIFTQSMDPRELDILMKLVIKRRVIKTGIKYGGRQYWHPLLGGIIGDDVRLRVEPSYAAPDEVEVFHEKQHLCTACADDTEQYDQVSKEVVADAQRQQVQDIREQINEKREFLKQVDKSIGNSNITSQTPSAKTTPTEPTESREEDNGKDDAPDLYDYYQD